jgi:peptidoglycan/LPS O-acetylase OafA/YrhL
LADSLRAIAVIMVVACHAAGVTLAQQDAWWGNFAIELNSGLLVFFLLSAFLLYRPFVAGRLGLARAPAVAAYARRRMLRIVPAYWTALTLAAAWPGLLGVFTGHWWRYYGFLNIYWLDSFGGGIAPAWSLSIEASFYVVLPLFALGMVRLWRKYGPGRAVRIELALLVLIAGAGLTIRAFAKLFQIGPIASASLFSLAQYFAVGMMIALASVALAQRPGSLKPFRWLIARPDVCWLLAAASFVVAAVVFNPRTVPAVGGLYPIGWSSWMGNGVVGGAFAVFLVLPALFPSDRRSFARMVLESGVLRWLGVVSYGIFLWHFVVLVELARLGLATLSGPRTLWFTLLTLAGTVPLAAASYYIVELPFLRRKEVPLLRPLIRRIALTSGRRSTPVERVPT